MSKNHFWVSNGKTERFEIGAIFPDVEGKPKFPFDKNLKPIDKEKWDDLTEKEMEIVEPCNHSGDIVIAQLLHRINMLEERIIILDKGLRDLIIALKGAKPAKPAKSQSNIIVPK